MASRALTTRFKSTCCSCPASARTFPASGLRLSRTSTSSPTRRTSMFWTSATKSLRLSTIGWSTCWRLNANNWRVRVEARWAALRISSRSPRAWCPSGNSSVKRSAYPKMAVRTLLKSWPTPPEHLLGLVPEHALRRVTGVDQRPCPVEQRDGIGRVLYEGAEPLFPRQQVLLGPLALDSVAQHPGQEMAFDATLDQVVLRP